MLNVVKGQKVFIKLIGNAARRKLDRELIEEGIVEDVKRKWFTIEKYWRERFSLETGYNDGKGYISNYIVYESKQDILDEQEIKTKCLEIGRMFEYGRNIQELSLEKIRTIHNIVFGEHEK